MPAAPITLLPSASFILYKCLSYGIFPACQQLQLNLFLLLLHSVSISFLPSRPCLPAAPMRFISSGSFILSTLVHSGGATRDGRRRRPFGPICRPASCRPETCFAPHSDLFRATRRPSPSVPPADLLRATHRPASGTCFVDLLRAFATCFCCLSNRSKHTYIFSRFISAPLVA
jgi:hypothetical protein